MSVTIYKFAELFDFQKKSKIKAGDGLQEGKYPFYTSSPIQSKFLNETEYNTESLIFGTGGLPSIHHCTEPFSVSTDCLVAQPSKDFYVRFVYYYLTSNFYLLENGFKGAGLKHISKTYISNIDIPLPSLEEQKRIVALLDKADALRQKRKQAIALLDDYIESLFIDMFGDPVSNPKGWESVKFNQLGTLDRGASKHRPRNAPELLGGEHPLIQTGDVSRASTFINNYKSTYSDLGLKQSKKWSAGTLCITIAANIADAGILTFDACFPDSVVGFIPNKKVTNSLFILHWLSFLKKILEETAPQVAQKNINLRILRGLDVIKPPVKLQNDFEAIVLNATSIKQAMLKQTKYMDNQLNAIMQKSFTNA